MLGSSLPCIRTLTGFKKWCSVLITVHSHVQDARGFFQETTEENYKYPLRIADAISYMGNLSTSLASPMPCSITPVSEAFPISLQPEFDFEEEEEEERRRRSV